MSMAKAPAVIIAVAFVVLIGGFVLRLRIGSERAADRAAVGWPDEGPTSTAPSGARSQPPAAAAPPLRAPSLTTPVTTTPAVATPTTVNPVSPVTEPPPPPTNPPLPPLSEGTRSLIAYVANPQIVDPGDDKCLAARQVGFSGTVLLGGEIQMPDVAPSRVARDFARAMRYLVPLLSSPPDATLVALADRLDSLSRQDATLPELRTAIAGALLSDTETVELVVEAVQNCGAGWELVPPTGIGGILRELV